MYPASHLTGLADVCTPRGERFRMRLGGSMRKNLNLSTDGEAISLYMNYWPWYGTFVADHRPRLEFRGKWQNPNIVMDDHGSIGRAFLPDGTVYRGQGGSRPYMDEVVPITFVQGSRSELDRACRALPK